MQKMLGKKLFGKKSEKTFSIFTGISWPKNWGEKHALNNFSRNIRIVRAKNGKKLRKEVRKTILYSYEYPDQKMVGKKRAKQFFQNHTNSASKKCWWKNSSERSPKKRFLYSQEYRDQKIGGRNARKNFSRHTRIVPSKNVGKKSSERSAKKRFLYTHEYRDQKMREKKSAKQYFQIHMNSASKKV